MYCTKARRTTLPDDIRRAVTRRGFTPRNGLLSVVRFLAEFERHAAQQKIVPCRKSSLGEMQSSGPHRLLVYCADYKCAHHVETDANR
jgi:hypothetical protein